MRPSAHCLAHQRCSINIHCCSALPALDSHSPQPIPYHSTNHTRVCCSVILPRQTVGSARAGPLPQPCNYPTPSPGHDSDQGLGNCFLKDPDVWFPCLPASTLLSLDHLFLLSQPMQLCSYWAKPSTNVTFLRISFLSKLTL